MDLKPGDVVAYQGVDQAVTGFLDYALPDRRLRLVAMAAGATLRFLDPVASGDRLLLLDEIAPLDIDSPPPSTIYHLGESYLLRLAGHAQVHIDGSVPGRASGACELWRFAAAGGRFLQIEAWPERIRMLAGTTIHASMLEVRPARPSCLARP